MGRFKIRLRLRQIRVIFFLGIFRLVAFFVKSNAWVICERGTEARDNGYAFYKYLKAQHPEQRVYYLITRDSADYKKVEEDAVIYGSIKSFWVIAIAEKIISAHYASVIPLNVGARIFHLFKLYKKFYFLQHGIVKDDLKVLYADVAPMRMFVCGAKPEYDDVKNRFGHPSDVVRYTGLARFDYLYDAETREQILIMPTWRTYLRDEHAFLNSEYFEKWQKILSDSELNSILEEKRIKLVFYVHYEMQKFISRFMTCSNNVVIASFNEYDVQTLLKESKLLITDYSSVFFDFAYMKKPMVFYQFDQYHYAKGYFDYHKHGFGTVCSEHEQVREAILEFIENGFCLDNLYEKRIDKFFPLRDSKNCERIYQALLEIK